MIDEITIAAAEIALRNAGEVRAGAALAEANARRDRARPSRAISD
ncbi:hypothetical protein [Methylocella tundrae]|nr:hypothetical protein [Methylocella tundrae]WPP04213.1 hypothetical protein SIN04_17435 [Methylocella tundrae]